MNSVLDCSIFIILGQSCVLVMTFLQQEHSRVWCREGQASFGARNRAVVWVTVSAGLIFCAERQSLLVQVQPWDDVAVLCLRSDLVALQLTAV